MKIYILPVRSIFQPKLSPIKYPLHNKDYGIEQDFLKFLYNRKNLITESLEEADWHYLPIFWTRWHLVHNYGRKGRLELQREFDKKILNDKKTFTICQYNKGPLIKTKKMILFLGSRKTKKHFDVPLICSPHRKTLIKPRKNYLASFVGSLKTHPLRQKMANLLRDKKDIYIYNGVRSSRFFVKKMLGSYIALCPRGIGGSSFRFYEAMQLGVVPFLIGEIDTRPFKKFINWSEVSFYSKTISDFLKKIEELRNNLAEPLSMGKKAAEFWKEKLNYQKWCHFLIKELENYRS